MDRTLGIELQSSSHDLDDLIALARDAQVVLIGEATHGTHEFYRMRAEITKRLISQLDFSAVCIEGDWPDAYRVNRFVRGADDDVEAVESLGGFARFPTWMWRNAEVLDFVSWLREHNDERAGSAKAGFYGLDLYSLYASIDAIVTYLDRIDPDAAARARLRYACLTPYEEDAQTYAVALFRGLGRSCSDDVLAQLREIQRASALYAKRDGRVAEDEYFYAEQNAWVVANAEQYYGAMLSDAVSLWNLRDRHMIETLERLMTHLQRTGRRSKAVVWAHNSHVGDARATSMRERGETNIGALSRERFGSHALLVGQTMYAGTVTAADDWHGLAQRKKVLPAREDSYEGWFHRNQPPEFYLPLRRLQAAATALPSGLRERAIGVIYRPQTELASHYFRADLAKQFDAIFHIEHTRAVEPLERSAVWVAGEVPETYPSLM
ncbi:MAG: erythromycin esterase family protein [Vulcanimicrobiaceae bacterium]